jgi:A/G-specific adenine glycosylase
VPPALQLAVLSWGERERRDLPWRRTRDPWAILVSEVMLQQTQVARVIPRYHAFLARFPTVVACAGATVGEVLEEWAGLGYNGRAVRLHAAACMVMQECGGSLPRTTRELERLPGVGRYTARAVVAFAFEADAAVVDTNVARVLARLAGRSLTGREVHAAADAVLPPGEAWAWNQALLDLGATRCRPSLPDCDRCPLAPACQWHARRRRKPDPAAGSAGVSRGQSRFDGSDRQGRGRLVAALRRGPVPASQLASAMGWPADGERAERVARTVVADGLAVLDGDHYRLP